MQPVKPLSPSRFAIAFRNLLRHRSRTAATLLAIGLGVASMVLAGGFVQDILIQLGEATIHSQTGHIQLAKTGYWSGRSRVSDQHMIENPPQTKKVLAGQPGVQEVVSRINFIGMLNNGKRDLGIIGEGIEPDGEHRIGSFLRFIQGRPLTNKDTDGIVLGHGVATALNLQIGDRVTLVVSMAQGAINTMDFQVIGIFQSFSKEFDARSIRIHISASEYLLDTQAAHVIAVTLLHTKETDKIASAIKSLLKSEDLQVLTWRELSDFYEKTVQLYDAQFGVLRLIIFLMVLLSVANSINMTLYERTKEFGTLLSLGDRPIMVFELIMMETAFLGLMGAGLGMLAGCAIGWGISTIGIPMPPPPNSSLGYTALIQLEPIAVLSAGAIGFFAVFFAAVYPAYRATKINIVDALRHGV